MGTRERFAIMAAERDSGDLDDFDEDDFDDEFDDDFEEELEDEYELSEFEDVTEDDLAEDEDEDLGKLGGDFVDEDAEAEEAPAAVEEETPAPEAKKPKKGARAKPADDEEDFEDED
jgi:hypothetical protein